MRYDEISEDRKLGKNIKDAGYQYHYVTIYRAVANGVTQIKSMDYITLSRKFAIGHAESNAVVYEEPQLVLKAMVKSDYVFEAYNPGEYFYEGPPVNAKIIKRIKPFE